MMKKIFAGFVICLLMVSFAHAQAKATKESSVALVKKAAAYVKEVGKDKALAEFNNPKGKFVDGENYLSVYDMKGVVIGHGTNSSLIGKDLVNLKDSQGKLFIQEFIKKADKPGAAGWVDYYWTNPVSKKIEPKSSYFERVGDMIIQAGYYK
jgi:signal transduction histidine kinase